MDSCMSIIVDTHFILKLKLCLLFYTSFKTTAVGAFKSYLYICYKYRQTEPKFPQTYDDLKMLRCCAIDG